MKFRLPRDCHGVSVGGTPRPAAPDGTIEVAPHEAAALAPHGVRAAPEDDASALPRPRRPKGRKP